MINVLLNMTSSQSRPWVRELLLNADTEVLEHFFSWHGKKSLETIFAWVPPWDPPSSSLFLNYGIPDWVPIQRGVPTYLPVKELDRLRTALLKDISPQNPIETAFQLFCWVQKHVQWGPVWGSALPSETLERGVGASLHIAQLFSTLGRLLFLPVRIVEEIALIPDLWREQALTVWDGCHPTICTWLGEHVFYHPFCEVFTGNGWLPVDSQRSQFGTGEILQHIRTPHLLKLAVRTWLDDGPFLSRAEDYILSPLKWQVGGTNHSSRFVQDLDSINFLLRNDWEKGGSRLAGQKEILDRIAFEANRIWHLNLTSCHCFLEAGNDVSDIVKVYLQSAIFNPLRIAPSSLMPSTNETRLLIGQSVMNVFSDTYWRAMEQGAHIVVFLQYWGSGEPLAIQLLKLIGGTVGPWAVPVGQSKNIFSIRGDGCGWQPSMDHSVLNLSMLRILKGIESNNDFMGVKTSACNSQNEWIAFSKKIENGRLTVIPVSLVAQANPYAVDFVSGCHRRIIQTLISGNVHLNFNRE